jgi:hypothetical protein
MLKAVFSWYCLLYDQKFAKMAGVAAGTLIDV